MTASDVAKCLLEKEITHSRKRKKILQVPPKECDTPQGTKMFTTSDLNVAQNVSTSTCKPNLTKIMIGNWVVKYAGKNSIKNYIGQITGIDGEDFIVLRGIKLLIF